MSKSQTPHTRGKINLRLSSDEGRSVRTAQLAAAVLVPRKDVDLTDEPEAALYPAAVIIRAGLLVLAGEIADAMKDGGNASPRLAGALRSAATPTPRASRVH